MRKKDNEPEPSSKPLSFDTDSYHITVDNGCRYSNKHYKREVMPRWTKTKILGSNGKSTALYVGTMKWRIEDDDGRHHEVILSGTYYSEYVPYKLLSPQHWAQTVRDHYPTKNGTWSAIYNDSIVLYWDQNKYKRTLPLTPGSKNVGILHTAPSKTKC